MKYFVTAFVLIPSLMFGQIWKQKKSFPGNGRYGVGVFAIDGKGYVGGTGGGSGMYKDLYEYNPTNDTWISKTSFPGTARRTGIGFGIDSLGYIGLGWSGSSDYHDFYSFNPRTNTWTQKSNYPGVGRNTMATSSNTKGYVGGGSSGVASSTYSDDFYEYESCNR